MNPGRPSSKAMDEAKDLLRSMSLSRQAFALYERGHPNRGQAVAEAVSAVRRLRRLTAGETVLFVGWGGFYLGPTLLPRASLTYSGLLRGFNAAGIYSVEFLAGTEEEGLEWLMERLVSRDVPAVPPPGSGIVVNRLRPVAEPDGGGGGMRELLRTYASGLDFMRETALRVENGEPANIQGAGRLTDTLADQVIADTSAALLLTTIKSYDEYTYYHMVNVCILSLAIGQAIGLGREQVVALGVGGLLHDVGKITIPREILQQAGPLSQDQWRLVHRHPIDGVGLLISSGHDLSHPALPMILEHHVGYDHSGYPSLGERRPSVPARIVAVADCFDALTSRRQYRKAEERRQALNIIQAAAGRGYDPTVVRIFTRTLGLFPIGSLVRLTSGETGVVVRNHDRLLARPVVRLLLGAQGDPAEAREVDLSEEDTGGGYRCSVSRIVAPGEVDVDMLALLSAGRLEAPNEQEGGPGLVHEPAHGEAVPNGYVDGDSGSGHLLDATTTPEKVVQDQRS